MSVLRVSTFYVTVMTRGRLLEEAAEVLAAAGGPGEDTVVSG